MENEIIDNENNIIFYTDEDNNVKIEVILENENVWLTQNSLAKLFDTTRNNITMHIKNIFTDEELEIESVSKENLLTANDGKRYKTKLYNLDMIISLGFRVNSKKAIKFRTWANKIIKEYMVKGFVLDDDRFLKDVDYISSMDEMYKRYLEEDKVDYKRN